MWLLTTSPVPGNLPFELRIGVYLIGRSTNCDVIVGDITVSRAHARLTCHSLESAALEDLSSKNGTIVNEVRIRRCDVAPPCSIRLGTVELRLVLQPPFNDLLKSMESEGTVKEDQSLSRLAAHAPLTNAQLQVLARLLEGMDEKEIAEFLHRSRHTIHNHVRAIYEAFGVHSRAELLAKFLPSSIARHGHDASTQE